MVVLRVIEIQSFTCSHPYQSPAILIDLINALIGKADTSRLVAYQIRYFPGSQIHYGYPRRRSTDYQTIITTHT